MRRFLYLSLIERLKQLTDRDGKPVIRTFDLWNEQISFLEQEEPFDAPAVFIEFRPVKWTGGGTQTADVTLRLHIVTPWKGSSREGGGFQQQDRSTLPSGRKGTPSPSSSRRWSVSTCWTAWTGIFSTSPETTATFPSVCSDVPEAARTTIMRNLWRMSPTSHVK